MNKTSTAALLFAIFLLGGCSRPTTSAASPVEGPKRVAIPTAQAVTRVVPAGFDATGAFAADEQSDIAPLVAGRVLSTPVNAGDFVRQGQVVCELDHRDAQLRLAQARAQAAQATAAQRQAESRMRLGGGTA